MKIFTAILLVLVAIATWGYLSVFDARKSTTVKSDEPLYWVAPMDSDYKKAGPGKSPMGMDLVPVYADKKSIEEEKPLYWVAPMDPDYTSDKPGQSPMGMDLVPVFADKNVTEGVIIPITSRI